METLNTIETTTIEVSFAAPAASATYFLDYADLETGSLFSASAVSTASKSVTFALDDYYRKYSGTLEATMSDASANYLLSLGIDVVKPYCDLDAVKAKLNINTASVIQCEKVARKVIESEAGSFQLVRAEREVMGMGMDYLMIPFRIQTLYKVYENGELVHDSEDPDLQLYKVSKDGLALVPIEAQNRVNYPIVWKDRYREGSFTDGYEYLVEADYGYKVVPEDIQEACELSIQDISGNTMRFINKNIQEFDNREFKIKFADGFNTGTGNAIADKILSSYKNRIYPGVL